MAATPLKVRIRGILENPSATEINVRAGPNAGNPLLFRVPVGTTDLPVLEARTDEKGANFKGKIYQWLRVAFTDGTEGWVRDDLIEIQGDGTPFGYPALPQLTYAFGLNRDTRFGVLAPGQHIASPTPQPASAPAPAAADVPSPAPAAAVAPPSVSGAAAPVTPVVPATPAAPAASFTPPDPAAAVRVRKAAFNITAAFEGGGYATYQSYDSGIISYGRFQFTLAAGSMITVVTNYVNASSSDTASQLREYLPRLNARDEALRGDQRLKALLQQAAQDKVMQDIQDQVAVEGFYNPVFELSINPRGLTLPLGQALLFDMAIQHGRFNHLVPKTEEVLGVPNKSRLVENGVSQEQFITTLAGLRRDNLYALATKNNLPGLRPRGDFWVNLASARDWFLQGDASGNVNVNGKIVPVRNP